MVSTPVTPAYYPVRISHQRRDPIEYGFVQRSATWLIDIDAVPSLPAGLRWLAGFPAGDHLGGRGSTLRESVDAVLSDAGIASPHRVLMLANPRVLGYVFNPLTVFYCLDAQTNMTHLVAEVRNTYGGRHDYVLEPDAHGRADTEKVFYVSPFYPVDGEYSMRLPIPDERLQVTVTMRRPGDRPFVAALTGERRGGRSSLWRALRSPLSTRAVMFGIKRHGIRLYTKGLRPVDRPVEKAAERSVAPLDTPANGADHEKVLSS